jgi:hypothetical protein
MEVSGQQHSGNLSFGAKMPVLMHRSLVETQNQSGCGDEENPRPC